MQRSDIQGLDWIIVRMGQLQLDWPASEYHQLRRSWHKAKRTIEESAEEPGEALELMTQIIETPEFKHYRKTSKTIFEHSEAGKAKRRKWNSCAHAKRAQDPDYRVKKKAYDKARYQRRKAAL